MKWQFPGLACLIVALSGCGGTTGGSGSTPDDRAVLEEVGEAYRLYTLGQRKPPQKLEDLAKMQNSAPSGIAALKAGLVVVRYGATMPDTDEEPSKTPSEEILAYQKQVPEQGGYVLQLDRNIKKLTADEFKSAKKAGKD